MKKCILVTQAKGGVGKTSYSFILCHVFPDARPVDMDDATRTLSRYIQFKKVTQASFLSENKSIDRGHFDAFFENVAEAQLDEFICDLGASVSEQLPSYFQERKEIIKPLFEALNIAVEVHVVVAGGAMFESTIQYATEMIEMCRDFLPVKIVLNKYFDLSEANKLAIDTLVNNAQVPKIDFNIAMDKNEQSRARIHAVMTSGKGLEDAPLFSKAHFDNAIKQLKSQLESAEVSE